MITSTVTTISSSSALPPTPPPPRPTQRILALPVPAKCTSAAHVRAAHARALRAGVRSPEFWTSLARTYFACGATNLALLVFVNMSRRDHHAFPLAFKLCSILTAYDLGLSLHADLIKSGFHTDPYSVNSLITFYSNFSQLDFARQLFNEMPQRTTSSWASLISGLQNSFESEEAIALFVVMLREGFNADEAAAVSALVACTQSGCLEFGEVVHAYAIVSGYGLSSVVFCTALVDMYAKCGKLEASKQVFDRMPQRNVLTWTSMIGGLAMHGLGMESLLLFNEMLHAGVRPTYVTMTNALAACSHAGLVNEGLELFNTMKVRYSIEPKIEHYGCVVDLLGRAGLLREAVEFISSMPIRASGVIWRSLLSSACMHGNLEISKVALERLVELGELVAGDYVVLSNLCAKFGYWEDMRKVKILMNDIGVRKFAGYSSVEINGVVHRFVMGDRSHPKSDHIFKMLELVYSDSLLSSDVCISIV